MKPRLLLLDDDVSTRSFIEKAFSEEFELISHPLSGQNPVDLILQHRPDCIIIDSFEACRQIKSNQTTFSIPLVLLSSKNKPSEISEGLSLGADDFIPKPFDRRELLQRLKSTLKNAKSAEKVRMIRVGDLEIDSVERVARFKSAPMNLTVTEFDILKLIASKPGIVVSREEIMRLIWKDLAHETTDRTIDVHIRSLRKKTPELAPHIKSVYGVGYQYVE